MTRDEVFADMAGFVRTQFNGHASCEEDELVARLKTTGEEDDDEYARFSSVVELREWLSYRAREASEAQWASLASRLDLYRKHLAKLTPGFNVVCKALDALRDTLVDVDIDSVSTLADAYRVIEASAHVAGLAEQARFGSVTSGTEAERSSPSSQLDDVT